MNQKTAKMVGYGVTGLFSLMMAFGGVMQMMGGTEVVARFSQLGITNLMTMRFLGLMKFAGAIGMWVPRGRPWAVHGFTFLLLGAWATHLGAGDPFSEFVGAGIGLCLLGASEWLAKKSGMPNVTSMTSGQRYAA